MSIWSQSWCDMIFSGRNKSYGAYMLRRDSAKRHIYAFLIVVGLCALLLSAYFIVKKIGARGKIHVVGMYQLHGITLMNNDMRIPDTSLPSPKKRQSSLSEIVPETKPAIPETAPEIDTIDPDESGEDATNDGTGETDASGSGMVGLGEGTSNPLYVAEKMPEFPGGKSAMTDYLRRNIHYPAEVLAKRISGVIQVSFVVGKDGSISDVAIIKGFDKSCEEEAIRVISQMPRWTPGMQRGKPVFVQMVIPLRFSQ